MSMAPEMASGWTWRWQQRRRTRRERERVELACDTRSGSGMRLLYSKRYAPTRHPDRTADHNAYLASGSASGDFGFSSGARPAARMLTTLFNMSNQNGAP